MAYKVVTIALDNIITPAVPLEAVSPSQLIGAIAVSEVDSGVSFKFAFGKTSDFVRVASPVAWEAEEDERGNGLYITNPVAQPGKSVDIVVTFAKPGASDGPPVGSMASADPSHANPATRRPPHQVRY